MPCADAIRDGIVAAVLEGNRPRYVRIGADVLAGLDGDEIKQLSALVLIAADPDIEGWTLGLKGTVK